MHSVSESISMFMQYGTTECGIHEAGGTIDRMQV